MDVFKCVRIETLECRAFLILHPSLDKVVFSCSHEDFCGGQIVERRQWKK